MYIFASEIKDNISDNITNNTSIAYTTTIGKYERKKLPDLRYISLKETLTDSDKAIFASLKDDQLYYHTSILVTSSWNKNDDVFRPEIIWAAKNTPVDKPTNDGHDSMKILGHMINSWAIDSEGNVLEDSSGSNLPDKFHILVGSVIYKVWPSSEEQTKYVAELIDKIEAGEKYVSMECTFDNFDYALADTDGNYKFVERNEKTAFLSKYLRAYGGDGIYNNYKIGRAVSKISFCGKGYVDKPANPESVIFTKNDIADFSKAEIIKNFEEKILEKNNCGVIFNNEEIQTEKTLMTDFYKEQVDELKSTNAGLVKSLDDIKDKLAASNVSKLEDEIKTLKAQIVDMSDVLKTKNDDITAKVEEISSVSKKLVDSTIANETLVKTNTELSDKVKAVEIEKTTVARVSTLVSGGFSKEDADVKVLVFANLDDTQFDAVAKELIEAKKSTKTVENDITKTNENPGNADAGDLENVEKPAEEVASAGASDGEFDIKELAGKLSAALKTKDTQETK